MLCKISQVQKNILVLYDFIYIKIMERQINPQFRKQISGCLDLGLDWADKQENLSGEIKGDFKCSPQTGHHYT